VLDVPLVHDAVPIVVAGVGDAVLPPVEGAAEVGGQRERRARLDDDPGVDAGAQAGEQLRQRDLGGCPDSISKTRASVLMLGSGMAPPPLRRTERPSAFVFAVARSGMWS
jgi:hypothetical protein